MRNLRTAFSFSHVSFSLAAASLAAFAGCEGCDVTPIDALAPEIQLVNAADSQPVCATDGVRDCAVSFGDVAINRGATLSITILNPTRADLHISSIAPGPGSDPAFKTEGAIPTVVESSIGASGKTLTLKFAPHTAGLVTGSIVITSDAGNLGPDENVVINLTGTGVEGGSADLKITPQRCDFGEVGVGATAYCDLNVENVGTAEIMVNDVGFEDGTDLTVFGAADPFATVFLAPLQAVTARLYARPSSTSTFTGTAFFGSTDFALRVPVPLTVTGALAPTAVARVKSINGSPNSAAAPSVEPLDDVILSADQSTSAAQGGSITAWQWTITERPQGSTVQLTDPTSRETGFEFNSSGIFRAGLDIAGTYTVSLVVTDSAGAVSSNDARVTLNAVPTEGLHIQITWDDPTNDIDLHVTKGTSPNWCDTDDDCFYGNCTPLTPGFMRPNWDGSFGTGPGDPELEVDDLDGFGPENTNIDSPMNGTYTVGVHYFSGGDALDGAATNVHLKVYISGALQSEMFGLLEHSKDLWTAVRVDVANGVYSVTPIDTMDPNHDEDCFTL